MACLVSALFWSLLLQAGAAVPPAAKPPAAASQPIALSARRLQFIRQALPTAHHARQSTIEAARLSPADRNNDTYLTVYDAADTPLGYVRDFVGPVSPNQACPCNPLHLSLVLLPDLRLKTILAPAPLQKWGHEAMDEADMARLIGLMQELPAALCATPTVEDMVDAQSGATRQPLADVVVHHAALSTRRIAGLVMETRNILRQSPIDGRRQRLLAILESRLTPAERANQLARLVDAFDEQGLRLQAFHIMVQAYVDALAGGSASLPAVEKTILGFAVLCEGGGNEVSQACLKIAQTRRRMAFVERCAAHLEAAQARGVAPQTRELLLGTAYFMDTQFARAVPLLRAAARNRTAHDDPTLFLQLAKAQAFTGDKAAAQQTLTMLLREHPLIPDGLATLRTAAGDAADGLLQTLHDQARQQFLSSETHLSDVAGGATLQDAAGAPIDLQYADPKQVTVLVFFATWCPHCQAELPHLKAFVEGLGQRAMPAPVRVVAVRTAVEKEGPAAQAFWQSFTANFPVYVDHDMSHAFASFARHAGRPTMLPTTAVIDRQGVLRFFIEPGLYRDVESELLWATRAAAGL